MEQAFSCFISLIIKIQLARSAFTNISQKAFLFITHKEERRANKISRCHGNIVPWQVKN